MHLTELTCDNFRLLQDLRFGPAGGLNIIRGQNAQGKTSILEAVLYLATSKSQRTNVDGELARHGKDSFRVVGRFARQDREVVLEAAWWQGAKRIKVNGVALKRVSDILGKVNLVLFSPEDIELVKGAATARRHFLDMELSQLESAYLTALQQYRQVLRQRNGLLRTMQRPDPNQLAAWDGQLVDCGSVLIRRRRQFVDELSVLAAQSYNDIARGEPLSIHYAPDVTEDSFATMLVKTHESDVRRGMTTRGPHRDDFEMDIDGRSARVYGSQGQQKTVALALKLGEMELIRNLIGEYPILMLDEVLAELDKTRARQLFDAIGHGAQCLITTTDVGHHPELFGEDCAYYTITGGRLDPQE